MRGVVSTQQAAELLGELIAIPSVNPNHQKPSGPPYGEHAIVDRLAAMLAEWGAAIDIREVLPGRPNLIARFSGRDSTRSLMLEAHSDTVSVRGMTVAPFEPTGREGRVYGRGACDNKGPMTAMLLGIWSALQSDGGLATDVVFVATCDEELGCTGAHRLVEQGFAVNAAVVAEPTGLAIVHAHKGAIRWVIETQGKTGHSSDPTAGVNAISQMRRVLEVIDGPVCRALATQTHPLLGSPTICVGKIDGGQQVNVIPALCRIEVDRRLIPGETPAQAIAQITDLLDAIKTDNPTFAYTWRQREYYPPLGQATDSPVTTLVADACRRVLGRVTLATAPWAATAGVFDQAGIPCVLFGPGSIEQAHTQDEFIELEQVVQAAGVYAEIIGGFGRSSIGQD